MVGLVEMVAIVEWGLDECWGGASVAGRARRTAGAVGGGYTLLTHIRRTPPPTSTAQVIELAKRGKTRAAQSILQVPESTMPKVMGVLAKRYVDRTGTYVRILKAGHKQQLDRAPVAVVELVDSPRDTVHALAQTTLPLLEQQLREVQGQRYRKDHLHLVNPTTGAPVVQERRVERQDLPAHVFHKLAMREHALIKQIAQMRQSLITWPVARKRDAAHFPQARAQVNAQALPAITAAQAQVRKRTAYYGSLHPEYVRTLKKRHLEVDERGHVRSNLARFLKPTPSPNFSKTAGKVRRLAAKASTVRHTRAPAVPASAALTVARKSPSSAAKRTPEATPTTTTTKPVLQKESELSGMAKLFSKLGLGKGTARPPA